MRQNVRVELTRACPRPLPSMASVPHYSGGCAVTRRKYWWLMALVPLSLALPALASDAGGDSSETHVAAEEATDLPESAPFSMEALNTELGKAIEYVAAVERHAEIQRQAAEAARRAERARRARTVRSAAASASTPAGGRCGGDLPPCWVMMRESRGDPNAYNPTGCSGRGCYGKWQCDPRTCDGTGTEAEQDAEARRVWDNGRGCSHWNACG